MRSQRTLRTLAALLSFSLVCAMPAHAGSVKFAEVEARASAAGQRGRSIAALRLHNLFQQGTTPTASGRNETTRQGTPSVSSLLSTPIGVPQGGRVETIELGEVNGTICDCGEISVPGGGFPRLPLLALAAVPLLFLSGRGSNGGRTNLLSLTPIPPAVTVVLPPVVTPPPPTPVPEPATLLLLGSGLLAFAACARRRSHRRLIADGFTVGAREAV